MTKYARDEFDRVPETSSRQGVHRVVSEAPRRRLGPVLAVGLVALAIGLVSFLLLPQLGFPPADTPASVSGETPAPTASQPGASSPPAAPVSPQVPRQPTPPPPATSAVDKTQPVAVYNAAGTAGLAGRVSGNIQADGWVLGEVANWQGAPQTTSVIFYSDPSQKVNAEALGKLLNIPAIIESAEYLAPVVVVLGPDFQ